MEIKIGCTVKEYLAGKGDKVLGAWSLGFEGSACTVGKAYEIKGISPTKNLIIVNDSGITKEYSPLHFRPLI